MSMPVGLFFSSRRRHTRFDCDWSSDVCSSDLRWSEPVSLPSERFRDFFTYNQMVYAKGQLFYEQLRYVVGDETMRRILRAYYARWKLKHVDEEAFREVAEQVSRQDLKWLFGQWLHGTPLIDYALKHVQRTRQADGRWLTVVTIERKGDGFMPVEIGTQGRRGAGDTVYARATGQPARERVEFTTAQRPGPLMLDPRVRGHDYDMLRSEEHTSELQSQSNLVCRLLLEKKKKNERTRRISRLPSQCAATNQP